MVEDWVSGIYLAIFVARFLHKEPDASWTAVRRGVAAVLLLLAVVVVHFCFGTLDPTKREGYWSMVVPALFLVMHALNLNHAVPQGARAGPLAPLIAALVPMVPCFVGCVLYVVIRSSTAGGRMSGTEAGSNEEDT